MLRFGGKLGSECVGFMLGDSNFWMSTNRRCQLICFRDGIPQIALDRCILLQSAHDPEGEYGAHAIDLGSKGIVELPRNGATAGKLVTSRHEAEGSSERWRNSSRAVSIRGRER